MKTKHGFTLVEIMIVVVIIGLLVTMAIPSWHQVRLDAQNRTINNNLRQLSAAAQQYFLENGVTQVTTDELVGTESQHYIKSIETVRGETYPSPIDADATALVADGVIYEQ